MRQKKKLEKKLKQLEELERIVKEKERKKNTIRAVIIMQKWVKGYQARKKYDLMKQDVRYFRKLRRILSVTIQKKQK